MHLKIRDGTIDDAIDALPMIRLMMPEHEQLTEEGMRSLLERRKHGIKVVELDGHTTGVNIWYEDTDHESKDDSPALYLWIGANAIHNFGVMEGVLRQLDTETRYGRWHTRTAIDRPALLHALKKYDFNEYRMEGNIVHLERYTPKEQYV